MPYPKKEYMSHHENKEHMENSIMDAKSINASLKQIINNQNRDAVKIDQLSKVVQETITVLAEMSGTTDVIKQGLNIKQSSSGEILNRPAQMHKLSSEERGVFDELKHSKKLHIAMDHWPF